MDKVDTNIVKDWAWAEGRLQQTRYKNSPSRKSELLDMFSRLRELRDQGLCELGVTSQLYTDYEDTNGRLPQEIEEMIGKYFDAISPGIFGTTLTTFPTVFANPAEQEAILVAAFPNSRPGKQRYSNNGKDVLQLYAHKVSARDFFITADRGIIRRANVLARSVGIKVKDLEE